MHLPPIATDDARRVVALHELAVLDTAPEEEFDAIVRVASLVCGVPISLISLVDAGRQWFKANVGLEGVSETPREQAFCAYAIHGDGMMVVQDTHADARFIDHPLVVGDPGIRFYAGCPLHLADGQCVGTLCVIDRSPRTLTDHQRKVLDSLAVAAVRALENRRAVLLQAVALDAQARSERALQHERERLGNILEGTAAGTWEWHVPSGVVHCNERWAGILGCTLAELGPVTLDTWAGRLHPDDLARAQQLLNQHVEGATPLYECEFRMWHREGRWVWVLARGRMMSRGADGAAEWVAGTHLDITETRQLASELAEQHELMRVTLQSIGDAVITTNAMGDVVWLNPVAERMTGWSSREAHGRPLLQVFHIVNENTREPAPNPVAACLADDDVKGLAQHTMLISRDGREYGIEDSAAPIRNDRGSVLGAVLVFHDVTEQRRLSGEMSWRATHDPLTGLVNRVEFEARLRRMLTKAQEDRSEHALLYVDLDQFKLVNDACGHTVGDQLLEQVARLLTDTARSRDTVARMGGDEFAVILEHCSAQQAQRVAQQICDRMEDFRFVHDGRRFRIGTSIGLVPVDQRWTSPAAIMQAADTSCYAAKEAGRNRVHTWFDTDEAMRTRHGEMRWATRLEQALDEDRFTLFAQRITPVTGDDGLIHAEVLLRLREADGSLVAPGVFLPAAERFHLASRIDRWVLGRVLGLMQAAPASALQAIDCLSVNLSGQSVGDRAMHRHVMALLKEAGGKVCRRLCIEITETAAVTNLADAAVFIEQVRATGAKVALDDFGAGASSFGYLKRLRVDVLKIDGQFIRDVVVDPLDEAAVRCFVDVARVAGLCSVAECVETETVLQRLRELGVDKAQGYLLHRPAPIEALWAQVPAQV